MAPARIHPGILEWYYIRVSKLEWDLSTLEWNGTTHDTLEWGIGMVLLTTLVSALEWRIGMVPLTTPLNTLEWMVSHTSILDTTQGRERAHI
jgi:hypothetical protein